MVAFTNKNVFLQKKLEVFYESRNNTTRVSWGQRCLWQNVSPSHRHFTWHTGLKTAVNCQPVTLLMNGDVSHAKLPNYLSFCRFRQH